MIAITVAIIATVYIYISFSNEDSSHTPDEQPNTSVLNGLLEDYYYDTNNTNAYRLIIDGSEYIFDGLDERYDDIDIYNYVGHNVNIVFHVEERDGSEYMYLDLISISGV